MPSVDELLEYVRNYPFPAPNTLDVYMRKALSESPRRLFLTPFMLPVFIANPTNYNATANWYDRNPLNVVRSGQNFIGAGAKTTRITYTVPVGRKCYIEILQAKLMRVTAPVALQLDWCGFDLSSVLLGQASLYTPIGGTVDVDVFSIGQTVLLLAGDVLTGWTFINSSGTVWYNLSFKGTEFDA